MSLVQQNYNDRNLVRQNRLNQSTIDFVEYLMALGDTQEVADGKVSELSSEVGAYVYVYVLGNMELINQINASSLSFMDADAKAFLTNALTPTV